MYYLIQLLTSQTHNLCQQLPSRNSFVFRESLGAMRFRNHPLLTHNRQSSFWSLNAILNRGTTAWAVQPLALGQVYLLMWQLLENIHPEIQGTGCTRKSTLVAHISNQLALKKTTHISDRLWGQKYDDPTVWLRTQLVSLSRGREKKKSTHGMVDTTLLWHGAEKAAVSMCKTTNHST